MCCVDVLILPVLVMILCTEGIDEIGLHIWIVGCFCLGFYTMLRILVFTDIAVRKNRMYLAGFGLMLSLPGDSIGMCTGVALNLAFPLVIIVAAFLLDITILVFFMYYNGAYGAFSHEDNAEALFKKFEKEYELSSRESDVFGLMRSGFS